MTRKTDPRSARLPVRRDQLPAFTPVPRQGQRHDGWTPARQHAFIEALADTGSVHAACKAVDMSQAGAYYLRRQPGAESFRAAWQAALDLGVQRIEDVAMDRALNGVDVPVYSYGKLVGSRTVYNDRLLMFMLRNRAPERFAQGKSDLKGLNAVGKMEKRRLKKKWRKEWEAELPGLRMKNAADGRKLIEQKLEELRQRVLARQAAEWEILSAETREAYARYEELRASDLGRAVQVPEWLTLDGPGDGGDPAERWWEYSPPQPPAPEDQPDDWEERALPPPGWQRHPPKVEEKEEGRKVRTVKDDTWR